MNRKGYTVLEIFIILCIFSIVLAVAYPAISRFVSCAKNGQSLSDCTVPDGDSN